MNLIPEHDILPLILSYVHIHDIKHVRLTCKSFYAATLKELFWKRNVTLFLKEHMRDMRFVDGFDTFSMGDRESLRQKVEFIFRKDAFFKRDDFCVYRDECTSWSRKTFDGFDLVIEFEKDTFLLDTKHYFKSDPFDKMVESWSFRPGTGIIYERLKYTRRGLLKKKYSDGLIEHKVLYRNEYLHWRGGCIIDKEFNALPHGDGTWTFPNGTTLKEEGIAWFGRPRIPLAMLVEEDEEMEPLIKKLKT